MPTTIQENNKRIAKNTLMLYFRMLLLMFISLYTSRVALNALGVENYGIYSVVGGIVVVFSFLNAAMVSATQRFLNFEMGRGDAESIRRVFNTAQIIHLMVSGVVLVLAETLGLWFLNTYMNISPERMVAANWVFQFSVVTFIVNVISLPYNATIIAHERMSAFAYISIYEAVAKLAIALSISLISSDKLIAYGLMIMLVQVSVRVIYSVYCGHYFAECRHFAWSFDKPLLKSMLSFSSWVIVGSIVSIIQTQGTAIIINIFFGATVNAAQGIASKVNVTVNQFVTNFMTAMNPQVVKSYASKNLKQMHQLVFRGCRFAFYLLSFFVIPIILEAPTILKIWLKIVPEYTVIFVRIVLFISLVNCFASPLAASQGATGKVKVYQLTLSVIGLFQLPFTILFYWLGYPPYYAMYVHLVIIIMWQMCRIWFVSRSTGFKQTTFYREVVLRGGVVFVVAGIIPTILHLVLHPSFVTTLIVCLVSLCTVGVTALYIGMTRNEREEIINGALSRLHIRQ